VHDLLNVVQKLGDKLERVMLFGHNPELTELAHRLSSEITHMPTCAVAKFMFRAKSWSNTQGLVAGLTCRRSHAPTCPSIQLLSRHRIKGMALTAPIAATNPAAIVTNQI
jgi:hypothetical protein